MKNLNKYLLALILTVGFCFLTTPTAFANQSPVANAGTDLYLISGQTETLKGSGSDLDGGTITYSWSCDGGILSASDVAQPNFTAPTVIAFNNYDDFTCTLTVRDSGGLSNSDTVKIYVNYNSVFNITNIDAKTESATNIHSNQATLNGSFTTNNDTASSAWFQYGFSTNYGEETAHQSRTGTSGSFTQNVSSLFLNATYHYRAVVQDSAGNNFYGQDMIFSTDPNFYNGGYLTISKKVINLTSGNLGWSDSVSAKPSDILSFSITIQANNKDLHNVVVKEILPANLTYNDNLLINATKDSSANPVTGINVGTIATGGVAIISYQVRVNPSTTSTLGTTNLNSDTTVYSDQTGSQTDSATIIVNNSQVSGVSIVSDLPTAISTGLTNNLFTESFFLPMLLIVVGSWLYFSGRVYSFSDWLAKYL